MNNRAHLAWIILPILPFLLGFALLELLNDGTIDLLVNPLTEDSFYSSGINLRFFNGLIVYSAVGFFHVCCCAAVIGFIGSKILTMDVSVRNKTLTVLGASVLLLVLVNSAARQEVLQGALNLSYRAPCAVLIKASVVSHVLPEGCSEPGLSAFAWFALLPYLFGLLAAAFASAIVSTAHFEENLESRVQRVDFAFQMTAFIMVTSTVALMMFYRLPLAVLENATARELIGGYSQGMGLFWGIVFTLTLLAVFGPSNILLDRAVAKAQNVPKGLRDEIEKYSAKHQISKTLTMLAPLLVGSSGTILELLTKSL